MANGDTKTNQYLDIAANGSRADLPADSCCDTRTQSLIRGVAERIMDVEDEVEELKNNPDVVDIVATYADLGNYDTSGLTDKDVIRVLQDETHNDDSTYYRWDATAQEWSYIGESKQYTDFVGTDGTAAGEAGLVPAPATTDAGKFLKADGTWDTAGSTINVVQTTGTSTTDVMSQKAVTDALAGAGGDTVYSNKTTSDTDYGGAVYIGNLNSSQQERPDPTTTDMHYKYFWALPAANGGVPGAYSINIMGYASNNATESIAIGHNAEATEPESLAIGHYAVASGNGENVSIGHDSAAGTNGASLGHGAGKYSSQRQFNVSLGAWAGTSLNTGVDYAVNLGAWSKATRKGEVNIGTGTQNYGYNDTPYRVLGGVHDPVDAHDAATKGYVDANTGYNFNSQVVQSAFEDPEVPKSLTVAEYQALEDVCVNLGKLYYATSAQGSYSRDDNIYYECHEGDSITIYSNSEMLAGFFTFEYSGGVPTVTYIPSQV